MDSWSTSHPIKKKKNKTKQKMLVSQILDNFNIDENLYAVT